MTEQHEQQQALSPEDEGEKLVLNSPEEASTARDFFLWAGVIVLAVMTAFSPALHGKFLWDDDKHVAQNPALRDATGLVNIWTGHWGYFFTPEQDRASAVPWTPQYYPITHTSFWIEAQVLKALDRPLTPTLFHVTNMVLHAISAILLWFILRALAVPGAWVAAAIWALHPMQAESVAWISERKNVLAGAFFFASILVYLRRCGFGDRLAEGRAADAGAPGAAPRTPSAFTDPLYWLAFGLFVLAVLSKTIACAMPAVMLLLIWWKRGKLGWRLDVLPLLPLFVFGFVMAMFTGWIERHLVGASGEAWDLSLAQHVLLAGNAIWFYAWKLVVPVNLAFFYPRWNLSPSNALLWVGVIATVAVPVLLFLLRRRIGRGPLVAWLIFCGVLVPALGFFNIYPMRYAFVADHFQYMAAPALVALIVATVAAVMRRLPPGAHVAAYVVAGLVLVALTGLTIAHASIFRGQLELWSDTAAKNPMNPSVRYNYGVALASSAGDLAIEQQDEIARTLENAAAEFKAATELNPRHERAWTEWGRVLLEKYDANGAIDKFERALAMNPQNVDALMGRGQALFQLKNWEAALPAYQAALAAATEQKLYLPNGRFKAGTINQMLGKIHVEQGNLAAAREAFREAVRIAPGVPAIHYDYGTLLARLSRGAATQPATTQGTTTRPATTQPSVVATTAPPAPAAPALRPAPATPEQLEAARQFAAAIQAAPDFIDARISLAELMLDVGNLQGAQTQLIAAARIDGTYPRLMEVAKRFDAAYKLAEAATRPAAATTQAADSTSVAPGQAPPTRQSTGQAFTAPLTQPATR